MPAQWLATHILKRSLRSYEGDWLGRLLPLLVIVSREEKRHTKLEIESWALSFRELLNDLYGKQLFSLFLEQEYSQENLHFWDACEDLKQSPQSKVAAKVSRIQKLVE